MHHVTVSVQGFVTTRLKMHTHSVRNCVLVLLVLVSLASASVFTNRADLMNALVVFDDDAYYGTSAGVATYGTLSTWDVTGVTDFGDLLENLYSINVDLTGWDTSSVTTMHSHPP